MKIFFTAFCCTLFTVYVNGQVQKKNWLFGGSMGFSSSKALSDVGSNTTSSIQLTGNAGYFIIDKLAIGLQPDFVFSFFKSVNGEHQHDTYSTFGPFLRYYLLPKNQKANIFMQSSYSSGIEKVSNLDASHYHAISFFAGPEIFIKSSIGIQLMVGYIMDRSKHDVYPETNVI
ncbi:MAG TPA: hypothetical protein VGI82_10835, partial [Chitinophagaceae bacterium]